MGGLLRESGRVTQLFEAASRLEGPDRASYLDQECAGDATLRAEVEALLTAARKTTTDEPTPPADREPSAWTVALAALAAQPEPAAQLGRGETIGRFIVLGLVGRGGMGEVYAAYDPELDRKVAVKVVRARVSRSGDDRGRLLREAQAIAKLSHPNVVVVYDVGTIGERVFIAMEFVEGVTVGNWMESERRPLREILGVFMAAGRGLAAAHRAGLVHRDFKPDNVMIGADGQVRVMDFGLARQVLSTDKAGPATGAARADPDPDRPDDEAQPLPDEALTTSGSGRYLSVKLTETGVRRGSPAYMAPEQFMGRDTDSRTDQFSFCVALYEALYGQRPFAGETVIALQINVLEGQIRPAPPQSRVPSWIRRILLRGVSIEPENRFSSMEDLLTALANDPAKRTKRVALAGAAVGVMLAAVGLTHRLSSHERTLCIGGGAHLAGVWEAGSAESERRAAVHRAFRASGRSYAEQAYSSVARLLDRYASRWVEMYTEACEATHVRGEQSEEVLDLRMACLTERLGNARALSDVFAAADAQVVDNAVSAAAALPSVDRCADLGALRAVVKPPEDAVTRKRVDDLRRELAQLNALRDSGQCARAAQKADRLIADVRAVRYQPLLAETLYAAAQIGVNCGDVTEMLQRFRDAHAVASTSHNDEVAAQASALIPSFAINRLNQVVIAREWLGVARGDVGRLGRETLADAMLAQAEAMLASLDGDYAKTLASADRSIAVTRRLLGPDDPLTIQWEANKGNWQEAAGHLDEALQTDIQAREHLERVLGAEHPRVAYIWSNEGEVLDLLGRYPESEAAYRRAAELFRVSGADPEVLAWVLTGLGRARLNQKESAGAVAPLEEALAIRVEKHAPSRQLGETRFALARALGSTDRRRALSLAASARADSEDDGKTVAEIDAWLTQARGK
jgi:tetratricopeptide (TPR) repeat protein/predicted Ser/Thr protein kinase